MDSGKQPVPGDATTVSRQRLEASSEVSGPEVHHQKVCSIGEVIADGESDQVVVNTLADHFEIRKATSQRGSAQLVGSMTDETLRQLSQNRYSSRFGAANKTHHQTSTTTAAAAASSSSSSESRKAQHGGWFPQQAAAKDERTDPEGRFGKPSPNQTRKRMAESEN